MHRPLVAAVVIVVSAMAAFAAVPLGVSAPSPRPPAPRAAKPGTVGQTRPTATVAPIGATLLVGQVLDARGAPLASAVVDASHPASGWRALALTDVDGRFRLADVPDGALTLTIRRGELEISHQVQVVAGMTSVIVRAGAGTREQDLAMQVGRVAAGAPSVHVRGNVSTAVPMASPIAAPPITSLESYARVEPSGFRRVGDAPISTFSVDVDTASYSNARRFLMEGLLPPLDAVRVEEWLNYFTYAYPSPAGGEAFRVGTALVPCPWNRDHQLLRVGVRARPTPADDGPAKNLVFLVDVSGSMLSADKLPLVRTSLRMLTDQLSARDRIAVVVYAGRTEVVLPSTPGDQKPRIHAALERLEAGGSTNGAGGIQLAYRAAREGFIKGGVNRVVLATDGDFNVGVTSMGELTRLIEQERESGVFLSVLGVGRGNLKDSTLEALADRGNGNYAYVDSLQEARRVLVEQMGATLVTIAKDVKLQVEFNPRHVAAYRLIGYENRALATEDFANDAKDAGEVGAGHTVTALYEIVPPGAEASVPGATPLRYQQPATPRGASDELATISVRHKQPDGVTSAQQSHPVAATVAAADTETAFAAAVAEVALVLRKDPLATGASLGSAITRAKGALGADPGGWRAEFVRLAQLAVSLDALQKTESSQP